MQVHGERIKSCVNLLKMLCQWNSGFVTVEIQWTITINLPGTRCLCFTTLPTQCHSFFYKLSINLLLLDLLLTHYEPGKNSYWKLRWSGQRNDSVTVWKTISERKVRDRNVMIFAYNSFIKVNCRSLRNRWFTAIHSHLPGTRKCGTGSGTDIEWLSPVY